FRARLFFHLQRLSLRYHDTQGPAESVYRVQMDAPAIRDIAINSVIPTLGSSLTLVAMVVIIVSIDWQLAVVALAVSPVLFVLARSYTTRMRPRYREARRLEGFSIEIVQQALAAFRVVKAFGRAKGEQDRFEQQADNVVKKRLWLGWAEGVFGLMVNLTIAVGSAFVLYVGIRNVLNGQLTLGELLVVLAYIAQLYEPLRTISRQASSLQSSLVSAERAFEVLDEIPDVVEKDSSIPLKNVVGSVEFRNVFFSHVGRGQVLDDICFRVPFGIRLGL
ncbi:MAG: ABC transporter transmembrane domain-containing protein, partial [Chloroflexota bacterium]|nr:ABC transporter transmembrane domain-containing protein [Chloroflexota bacterium]